MNSAFKKFALANDLKRLICYRDGEISSDLKFDSKGNVVSKIEVDNEIVPKSEYEYFKNGEIKKTKHYFPNGNFDYGFEYEYLDNKKITYKNPGKILYSVEENYPLKKMKITTDYREDDGYTSKEIEYYDDNNQIKKKEEFYNGEFSREFVYYTKKRKDYVDEISYSENGKKFVNTKRIWSNDVYSENGNLLLDYSGETLNSRLEYNKKNRLISRTYYLNGQNPREKIEFRYRNDTILVSKKIDYLLEDRSINYEFLYDDKNHLKKVIKTTDKGEEVFSYEYTFK